MTRKQVTAKSLLSRKHLRKRTFRRAYERALRKEIVAAQAKKKRLALEAQDTTE